MANFTRQQIYDRYMRISVGKLMKTYQKILHPKVYEFVKNEVDKRGNKIWTEELMHIVEEAAYRVMCGEIILE